MAEKTANLYARIEPETKNMTEEQFNAEIEKGYKCIENGDVMSVAEAFASIKRV